MPLWHWPCPALPSHKRRLPTTLRITPLVHPASTTPMADGEVRKIDKEQGKVTLKHGPIASLDMPGMTMVFKVADPKMLDTLKQSDKVKFAADKVDGAFTVTAIDVSK